MGLSLPQSGPEAGGKGIEPFNLLYAVMNGVSGAAMLALVAIVIAGRGDRSTRALLSLVLLVSGIIALVAASRYVTTDVFLRENIDFYVSIGTIVLPLSYLAFLGAALRGPLVRPLHPRWVQAALLGVAGIVVAGALIVPDRAWAILRPTSGIVVAVGVAVFLYATLAAFDQYRRAPAASIAKRQGGAYLAAFLFHDALWIAAYSGRALPHGGARDVL